MLTQKLFNTQLGGEDRIHNLDSLTGLSTAGEACKQAHQCNYCGLRMKINTQVRELRAQLWEQRMPCRMGAGDQHGPHAFCSCANPPRNQPTREPERNQAVGWSELALTMATKCEPLSLKICLVIGV